MDALDADRARTDRVDAYGDPFDPGDLEIYDYDAKACFHDAILVRADLAGSLLGGADLSEANLTGASLRSAHCCGADLTKACLQGADLTGANLTKATVTGARYNALTRWPAGFDPRKHGAMPVQQTLPFRPS